MTIDEAIEHANQKAKENRDVVNSKGKIYASGCLKCAEEHEQLADWLTELKAYRSYKDLYQQGRADAIEELLSKCEQYNYTCNSREFARIIREQLKENKNE